MFRGPQFSVSEPSKRSRSLTLSVASDIRIARRAEPKLLCEQVKPMRIDHVSTDQLSVAIAIRTNDFVFFHC